MKKKILIIVSIIAVIAVAVCVYLHSQRQTTFLMRITVPAGSQEKFVYSDEEISPIGDAITIWAEDGLGDTEVVLLPVEAKEKTEYAPTYLTHGMPATFNAEKGAWFKVGISQQNTSSEDINSYVKVSGVKVRIE